MTFTCDFDATPRGVVSGKTVRFYPRVSGNISPITNYNWDFGDGSSPVDEPTPIHTYPVVTGYTTYAVVLTVTDSNSNQATHTNEDFITSDIDDNVVIPEFNINVIVFIWDDAHSMQVKRQPYADCNLYLISPKISDQLDKIGTATFALLDIGTATADELSLIKEGSNVAISSNKGISFQGVIRRAGQDLQGAFAQTTRVKKWNIECDSDLARHKKMPILASQLTANGEPVIDSPGYIARRLLTPAGGAQDVRGVIDCIDPRIAYRLNSTAKEEVGSQYEHLMTLRDATNYDIRSRPYGTVSEDQELGWGYQPFNGNFEIGEFFGDYDYGWGECGELEAPGWNCASWSPWGNEVTPIAKKDGNYGMRMRVKINDDDPDDDWLGYYFGSWNNVFNFTNAPAGFTSISFDYKIVKYSHKPTYTDINHRWGGECAVGESAVVLWLEDGGGNDLWVEDTGEVGDWIHVDIPVTNPGANFEVDFYLTTEFNVPLNQSQTYEYDYYFDNVRYNYADDVAAGVWAYIKLKDDVAPPYAYDGCGAQLSNGHIIYGGGISIWYSPNYNLYRSTDNGFTFSQLVYNEDVFPSQMFAMGDRLFCCVNLDSPYTRHNLMMSVDEGLTWTLQSYCATNQWASYWVMGTTIHRLANFVYSKSVDYGVTWTINAPTPTGTDLFTDPSQIMVMQDGTIVLFAYLAIYHSHDEGANWTTVIPPDVPGVYGGYQGYYVMEHPTGTILSFSNESGSSPSACVVTTTDYGATWTQGNTLAGYRGYYDTPFFPNTDGTIIMRGMHYSLDEPCWYHSTDWGESYTLINGIPPSSLIGGTYYFGNLGIVVIASDNNADTVVFY